MRDVPILRHFNLDKRHSLFVLAWLLTLVPWSDGSYAATATATAAKAKPEAGREVAPGVREAHLVLPGGKALPGTGLAFSPAQPESDGLGPVSVNGAQDWATLLSDDFESGFPGAWSLEYPGTGPYWDDWTCWSGSSSSHSVGCAVGGAGAITCTQSYPANMNTWMTYGPGSLADPDILAGVLECSLNLNSELDYDHFYILVSIDGVNYNGYMYSGPVVQTVSLDLANVPTVGNVLGLSQVWVGFVFQSDDSVGYANGAQIDDVVLAVDMAAGNQAPQVAVTAPNGGEVLSAGSVQAITYTATDPDSGPNALTVSLDYSTNSGSTWSVIATGQANSGTYNWTVPNLTSSTVRVRVRAYDGADEANDTSNANFSIVQNQLPIVAVTSPNGGETLTAGSTTAITYTASDTDAGPNALSISFDYSTNGGGNWTTIATGQANTGTYPWSVPDVATSIGLVRVRASDGAGETPDVSNAVFSIVQNTNALALGTASGTSGTSVTVALSLVNEDLVKGIQADITFDGTKAYFAGIATAARTAGMIASGEQVAENRARIILYYDTASQLAAGTGDVAELTFTLQGPGGSTILTLTDMELSGTTGGALPVTGANGQINVAAPLAVPSLQITALKNPGRERTLQILVRVDYGSGSAPTVTAGGSTIAMTALGQAVYLGSYSATQAAASVTISASDTNSQGLGTAQTTVSFQ